MNQYRELVDFVGRNHDIPNWFSLLVSIAVWPLILWCVMSWWEQRTVRGVRGLIVSREKKRMCDHDSVEFKFKNGTGSVVYVTQARLSRCSRRMRALGDLDIGFGYWPMKFLDERGYYSRQEVILQTADDGKTAVAVREFPKGLQEYRPSAARRLWPFPKYFCLEYVAMVGDRRYRVATRL